MSGLTAIRLAAVLAVAYAVWVLVGGPIRFGAGAEAVTLRLSMTHAIGWLTGLIALVVGYGLWARHAWAWWLGLAAALFQGWRIVDGSVWRAGALHLPGATTLLVLALLLVFVVLLFMPKARASCNR